MDFNRVTKIVLTKGADTITVTQGIEAGSISISEILFDGSLEFGAINSNKLELRLYSTVDIKGYKIQLLQGSSFVKDSQENDTQELIDEQIMFTGYVQSCKLSGYDYYRDIIAYDELYFKKDLNIANFYSGTISQDVQNPYISFFDNDTYPNKTLKAFREALCEDFLEFTLATAPDLPNDPMTVEKTVNISSMKFSEMIKMVCELQGTIPNMTRDGKLEFVRLSTNNPKELIGSGANSVIETENSTFEDYSVNKITQVVLMGEDSEGNQQMVGWSDSANPNNNIFQIENNIFIRGKQETDVKNYANAIYKGIINGVETSGIKDITYTPAEIAMIVSDTGIKLGDIIKVKYEPDYTRDFEFQLNQPSDWSTAYNTYYKVTEWEANDVPEFRANTFFYLYAPASRPNVRSYRVLPNEPIGWDSNYTSYYKISKMSLNNSSSWVNNNTSTDGMYNNSANTYIFKTTKALERIVYCTGIELSGSQLVNETITCSGEESLSDSTSSSNPEFEALADKAYPIQTSMSVDYFRAKYISTDYIQAKSANFGEAIINNLVAGTITTEEINAIRAKIDTLDANTIASTWLTATYASLQVLTANTITSDVISTKYLTADMANLGQVGVGNFFAKAGIIDELQVGDGYVTGRLTGVKINADVIDTGTLAVERLIIKGKPTHTYTLQETKPSDWDSGDKSGYFKISSWERNSDSNYTPYKYFYYAGGSYSLLVGENPPSNWSTKYNDWYYVAKEYAPVSSSETFTKLGNTHILGTAIKTSLNNTFIYKSGTSYGNNSIMYQFNKGLNEVTPTPLTDEQLNTMLNGQIIIAESITATQIRAKAITSNKIDSKAIKSDHIDVGQIKAVHIDAGAITADKIKAGSITASCLSVGDFNNYFLINPSNLNSTKWALSTAALHNKSLWLYPQNVTSTTSKNSATVYIDSDDDGVTDVALVYLTDTLNIAPNTKLKISGSMHNNASTSELSQHPIYLVIVYMDKDNNYQGTINPYDIGIIENISNDATDISDGFPSSLSTLNYIITVPNYSISPKIIGFRIAVATVKTETNTAQFAKPFFFNNMEISRCGGGDIIAGQIMSRNGKSYFDLDRGKIQTNDAFITGGTITIGDDDYRTVIQNGSISQTLGVLTPINDAEAITQLTTIGTFIPVGNQNNEYWQAIIASESNNVKGISLGYNVSSDDYNSIMDINKNSDLTAGEVIINGEVITNGEVIINGDITTEHDVYGYKHKRRSSELQIGLGAPRTNFFGTYLNYDKDTNAVDSILFTNKDQFNIHIFSVFKKETDIQFDHNTSGYSWIRISDSFIGFYTNVKKGSIAYQDLYAGDIYSNNLGVSSIENIKTNITPSTPVLQSIFENSDIYSYNLTHQEPVINLDGSESFEVDDEGNVVVDDNGNPVPEMQTVADNETSYGFVIGSNYNTPQEVISEDGEHINLYSMASLTWKAVQELYERVKLLEGNNTQSV